jgi:heme oxygenase
MDTEMEEMRLTSVLRDRTRLLHGQAERSGIVADILRGRATVEGYALFLRNLAPAYRQLEFGLDLHRHEPGVRAFARSELYRSAALELDLAALMGPGWSAMLPAPSPAGLSYARRIEDAASGSGAALIGHAYVRYMGDLSGGQVMKRLLAKTLDLPERALSFYEFPEIEDLTVCKDSIREALDDAPLTAADRQSVIAAAIEGFAMNIEVSDAVRRASLEPEAGRGHQP